jgi:GDPmannose 4,6-dehydratase
MFKRALICGVSGQDGAYLADFLISKGYEVWGSTRNLNTLNSSRLEFLGVLKKITIIEMDSQDPANVGNIISKINPNEIYYLSGQSSVGLSFEEPMKNFSSIVFGCLNFLEAIRRIDSSIRFFNAGSGDCFGDTKGLAANESTSFNPLSPYGLSKASATSLTKMYRDIYGLFASTAILFNHESPLRSREFVTKKIVAAACRIKNGSDEKLSLGNIDVERDWGWAPDYVEAMWKIINSDSPDDFIVATGNSISLKEFIAEVFDQCGLDWRDHVNFDRALLRKSEAKFSLADPNKAKQILGWQASLSGRDVARVLVTTELNK